MYLFPDLPINLPLVIFPISGISRSFAFSSGLKAPFCICNGGEVSHHQKRKQQRHIPPTQTSKKTRATRQERQTTKSKETNKERPTTENRQGRTGSRKARRATRKGERQRRKEGK
jgi:hypothetical protein